MRITTHEMYSLFVNVSSLWKRILPDDYDLSWPINVVTTSPNAAVRESIGFVRRMKPINLFYSQYIYA
jgi:hypothetical protein